MVNYASHVSLSLEVTLSMRALESPKIRRMIRFLKESVA